MFYGIQSSSTVHYQQLFTLITEEKSIKNILDLGEKFLGIPLVYTNALTNRSYSSSGYMEENSLSSILEKEDVAFNATVQKTIDSTPVLIHLDSIQNLFVSKVYYGGHHLGYIYILKAQNPLESIELELIQKIGHSCAIMDLLGESISSGEDSSRGENLVFEKLLDRKYKTISDFNFVAKHYSFNTYTQFYIFCIHLPILSQKVIEEDLIRRSASYHVGLWYKVEPGKIIAMVGINPSSTTFNTLLTEVRKAIANKEISIGISDPFNHILATHNHFKEAEDILNQGQIFNPSIKIHLYDNRKFNIFLKDVNQFIQSPSQYISYKVMNILTYDKINNTDYASTLKAYLSSSLSPQHTAKVLFIHKNTVIYRINKIKNLFDVDFSDAEQCFQLYFSFQLLMTRGWKESSK